MFHTVTAAAFSINVPSKCSLLILKTVYFSSETRDDSGDAAAPHGAPCTRSVAAELPVCTRGSEPEEDSNHFVWSWPRMSGHDGPIRLGSSIHRCSAAVFPMMCSSSSFVCSLTLYILNSNLRSNNIFNFSYPTFSRSSSNGTCTCIPWIVICGILCPLLTLQNITRFLQFESGADLCLCLAS